MPALDEGEIRMKILITTDWYKPAVNGVVTSVDNLRKGLIREGHEVRILTLSGDHFSHVNDDVYFAASVSANLIYENARLKLHKPRHLINELIEWHPDVVHSQCELSTFGMARKIAAACNAPLIHTYHTVYEDYTHYLHMNRTVGRRIVKMFSRNVLSDVDAVITPSDKIKEMLIDYRVKKPIYVIPSGIEMKHYGESNRRRREEIRAKYGVREDECLLVYVGRFAREKNIGRLLFLLSKCDPNQRLMLVGDGPERKEIESLAEDLHIENRLIFTGMVDSSKVPDYYSAGDIFVSASQSETQGLTYMEAMASGRPILCLQDECLDGVVDNGVNSFVFNSDREFLKDLNYLKCDKSNRVQMGSRAQKSIRNRYSIEAFTDSCIQVYEEALSKEEMSLAL